jgi:HIRAN domain
MSKDAVITLLLQPLPVWIVLALGFVPALIARLHHRPIAPWCLYGCGCALLAWPLVALPTMHALLVRPGGKTSEQDRERQRRSDALALLKEESVRSYPSRIGQFSRRSPAGVDCRRYAYEHLGPGEALELVRERANRKNTHAVAYHHRGVHLGYVPKRQRWIADALDDGLRLLAITETVKSGWVFRRRARYVGTRIIILYDPR